jgi:hypothetical protein
VFLFLGYLMTLSLTVQVVFSKHVTTVNNKSEGMQLEAVLF